MTQVALYVTQGTFNCASSRFQVQLPPKKPLALPLQKEQTQPVSDALSKEETDRPVTQQISTLWPKGCWFPIV